MLHKTKNQLSWYNVAPVDMYTIQHNIPRGKLDPSGRSCILLLGPNNYLWLPTLFLVKLVRVTFKLLTNITRDE